MQFVFHLLLDVDFFKIETEATCNYDKRDSKFFKPIKVNYVIEGYAIKYFNYIIKFFLIFSPTLKKELKYFMLKLSFRRQNIISLYHSFQTINTIAWYYCYVLLSNTLDFYCRSKCAKD